VDVIQFQISFHELRPIASYFYELVCRKGINSNRYNMTVIE